MLGLEVCVAFQVLASTLRITGETANVIFNEYGDNPMPMEMVARNGHLNLSGIMMANDLVTAGGASLEGIGRRLENQDLCANVSELSEVIKSQQATISALTATLASTTTTTTINQVPNSTPMPLFVLPVLRSEQLHSIEWITYKRSAPSGGPAWGSGNAGTAWIVTETSAPVNIVSYDDMAISITFANDNELRVWNGSAKIHTSSGGVYHTCSNDIGCAAFALEGLPTNNATALRELALAALDARGYSPDPQGL